MRDEFEILRSEIRNMGSRLLKWQLAGDLCLALLLAKGFGWLGF